jgi:Leucine-rich repeat (LRR) protein
MPGDPSAFHLNLWKQRLGCVPECVWERTDLETPVLADNDLLEISEHIGRLKNLRMLDLGHNRLTHVPDALADLDELTDFLYLHDNQLMSLPDSVGRLARQRELHLRDNRLASLPESIGRLQELRRIHLRGSRLMHLHAAIASLPRLEELDLRWVGISPPDWIADIEARGCLVYR